MSLKQLNVRENYNTIVVCRREGGREGCRKEEGEGGYVTLKRHSGQNNSASVLL